MRLFVKLLQNLMKHVTKEQRQKIKSSSLKGLLLQHTQQKHFTSGKKMKPTSVTVSVFQAQPFHPLETLLLKLNFVI